MRCLLCESKHFLVHWLSRCTTLTLYVPKRGAVAERKGGYGRGEAPIYEHMHCVYIACCFSLYSTFLLFFCLPELFGARMAMQQAWSKLGRFDPRRSPGNLAIVPPYHEGDVGDEIVPIASERRAGV